MGDEGVKKQIRSSYVVLILRTVDVSWMMIFTSVFRNVTKVLQKISSALG